MRAPQKTRLTTVRTPTPESALLLACARPNVDVVPLPRVRSCARAVRCWPQFLALVERHRMLPLVYVHLRSLAQGSMPRAILEELREAFMINAERSFSLSAELIAVMALLRSNRVDALQYEGPALAQCIFGNAALREREDVRILLRAHDVPRAIALLERRGFRPLTRIFQPSLSAGLEYQCCLIRSTDDEAIELHWTVVPRVMGGGVDLEELWEQRRETTVLNCAIPTPSHEDLLVMLCMQGTRHLWARLGWLCCVAELIRAKPLTWCRVLDRADAWSGGRMLRAALLLAYELIEAPIPPAVLSLALADQDALSPVESVFDGLLSSAAPATRSYDAGAFWLRLQERQTGSLRQAGAGR